MSDARTEASGDQPGAGERQRLTRDPGPALRAATARRSPASAWRSTAVTGRADGTPAEQTGFVTVLTYQRLAEVCGQYLKKGSPVLVEGRLQMREWTTMRGEKEQPARAARRDGALPRAASGRTHTTEPAAGARRASRAEGRAPRATVVLIRV